VRCTFGNWCFFREKCNFETGASFGDGCEFGEDCKAVDPFWSFVYPPPFVVKGRIFPLETCRSFWKEKLLPWDVFLDGCYNEISEELAPKLDAILREGNWTTCERMMLESWKGRIK